MMILLTGVSRKIVLPKKNYLFVFIKQRKNYSEFIYPTARPESKEHCSRLLERSSYITEHRGLIIQKSLQNLQENPIKLKKNIRSIFINDPLQGKGTNVASLFLYEIMPIVKYHNPNLKVVCTKDESLPWNLEIGFEKDVTVTISTENRSYKSLLEEFYGLVKINE